MGLAGMSTHWPWQLKGACSRSRTPGVLAIYTLCGRGRPVRED